MKLVTTFPKREEYEKAKARLEALGLPVAIISPDPGYGRVGVPALVIDQETRAALASAGGSSEYVVSGWTDYYPEQIQSPRETPPDFSQDIFGQASVMVLAPCIADATKIRLIAHITGDMSGGFPYLNSDMSNVCYNVNGPILTFMDRYRMVTLYPRRIAIAKADGIVDGWRTLEMIRRKINDVWRRRDQIEPSDRMRQKPPALEIYKRLPGTNCRACGEKTCMAFALRLWSGEVAPSQCKPTFEGEFVHRREALLEICAGLGTGT